MSAEYTNKNSHIRVIEIKDLAEMLGVNYDIWLAGQTLDGVPYKLTIRQLAELINSGAISGLGLENVDNTSDADKPVSDATAAALAGKANLVGGILADAERPDIVSIHLTMANFPTIGDLKRFYMAKDTGILYVYSSADVAYLPINGASTVQVENYTHQQTTPAAVWNITHPLNKYPSVMVIDDNSFLIYGDVEYIGTTGVTVTFSQPVSGIAALN